MAVMMQAMLEQLWRAWSNDHLHLLQNRNKWSESRQDVRVNDLVIVKNPLLLMRPSKCELTRIVQVHPGADGHVCVVTLRTAHAQYKRPVTRICKLPVLTGPDALESKTT